MNLHSIAKNVLEMILKQVLIPKHMDFSVLVTLLKRQKRSPQKNPSLSPISFEDIIESVTLIGVFQWCF